MAKNHSYALGMIETVGLTCLLPALDDAVKSADVKVVKIEKVDAGIVTGYVIGDVSSVHAAIESGVQKAKQLGGFRCSKVISKPDDSIFNLLNSFTKNNNDHISQLELMTVDELRKMARKMKPFPMLGKEINKCKKRELIKAIEKAQSRGENK